MASIDKKISLFFDNEEVNFTNSLELLKTTCHNIIPIKVNQSRINTKSTKQEIEGSIDTYFARFDTITPAIAQFKEIALQWPIIFDYESGITTNQLKKLNEQFQTNEEFTKNIGNVVFDFDRTFTMVEGLARVPTIDTFITALRYQNPTFNKTDFVACHMGGYERMDAMRELINTLISKNIRVIILTNNRAPIDTPALIPDFLNTMGIESSKIDIISSHSYPTVALKYKIMNNVLNICGEVDVGDNIISTIRQCELQIFHEWTPTQKGGLSKLNKSHKSRKYKHNRNKLSKKLKTKQNKAKNKVK